MADSEAFGFCFIRNALKATYLSYNSYLIVSPSQVVRAGLNVEIAPDLIANQLNIRNGALILLVSSQSIEFA